MIYAVECEWSTTMDRRAVYGLGWTWLSWTAYWMLIRPTTLSARASLGVQSRITSRHDADIVCGGMLHAESPAGIT